MELGDLVLTGGENGQALANAPAAFPGQPAPGGVDFTTLLASALGLGGEGAIAGLPCIPDDGETIPAPDQEAVAAALLGGLLYSDGMGAQVDLSMTLGAGGASMADVADDAGAPVGSAQNAAPNAPAELLESFMPPASSAAKTNGHATATPSAAEPSANAGTAVVSVPLQADGKERAFAQLLKVGPEPLADTAARAAAATAPVAAEQSLPAALTAVAEHAGSDRLATPAAPKKAGTPSAAGAITASAAEMGTETRPAADVSAFVAAFTGEREVGSDAEPADGAGIERGSVQGRAADDSSRAGGAVRVSGEAFTADMRKDGTEKLGEILASQALRGGGRVKVRLQPPDLGAMQVEVVVRGKNVALRFDVENASAQQVLAREIPNLKDTLAGRGFAVDRADVYFQGGSSQSFAQRSPVWGMSGGSIADGEGDDGGAREETPRAGRVDIEV